MRISKTNFTNRAGFLIRCRDSFNFVVHICSQADISMISIFFLSLLVNIPILILPSTPKKDTRHRRAFAAPPLASVKYGAGWDKRRTPGEGFSGLFSGTVSLKNFVQILDGQVFALMQKTDCLSRNAASLTFSVSFLAKFCSS